MNIFSQVFAICGTQAYSDPPLCMSDTLFERTMVVYSQQYQQTGKAMPLPLDYAAALSFSPLS